MKTISNLLLSFTSFFKLSKAGPKKISIFLIPALIKKFFAISEVVLFLSKQVICPFFW